MSAQPQQAMLSLLIVTYNPGEDILACLNAALEATAHLHAEIIVIDNASHDATVERIRTQSFNTKVHVIPNAENVGFGTANNIGCRQSSGQYILLVNPDLTLTRAAVDAMLAYLQAHPQVGVISPKMRYDDGRLSLTARPDYRAWRILSQYFGLGRLFPRLVYGRFLTFNQSATEPFEADWLSGACLMFPRAVYEQLKGFDEGLFLFMEDVDICMRTKALGYGVIYLPNVTVTHGSGTTTSRFPLIRVRHYHKSPIHYYRQRNDNKSILLLKLGFTFELCLKLVMHMLMGILPNKRHRLNHARAEAIVLGEVWGY